MTLKKIFIASTLLVSILGFSSVTYAKEVHKTVPEVLKEVDAHMQAALDAIPSADSTKIATLIKEASQSASELSANYKFEFERDKVVLKLKKADRKSVV